MKKLICGFAMAVGLSFSCHAQGMKISQYPNTATLTGTNLFIIAAGTTNKNISYEQLSNLLAAAIGGGGGGAQVWTNDGTKIYPNNFSTPIFIGTKTNPVETVVTHISDYVLLNTNFGEVADLITPAARLHYTEVGQDFSASNSIAQNLLYANAFYNRYSPIGNRNTNVFAACLYVENELVSAQPAPWPIPMGVALSAYQDDIAGVGYSAGIYSWAESGAPNTLQAGLVAGAANGYYCTNIGLVGYVAAWGSPYKPSTAGLFEQFLGYEGDEDASVIVNSVILLDNRTTGYPLFVGRTNNGTIVASLGSSGVWTNQGTVCLSNATPAIPTAAALGAGGYWTGNSNGFLVTVYSLDGSTTVMKVLAP